MCWITSSCILFAYCTNRAFVFRSKTTGKAMAKEFGTFVTCRLGTMVLDAAIMMVGGQSAGCAGCGADGRAAMQGLLGAVAGWLGPDTTLYMANSFAGSHAGRGHGWLRCHCRHRRGGRPHSHLRHQRLRCSGNVGPCRCFYGLIKFFKKHWEVLSYLIFGVLTTLLNIVLYALFSRLFGYTAANSWGNVLDNALCILFAYCTNRAFVFRSKTTGKAMAKEFGTFVTCRLGTMVLDAVIMMVGGNLFAAQGAALVDTAMQGLLGAVAGWLGPDTTLYMANSFAGSHAAVADGSAAIAVIGGADGPTAIFVTSAYDAQAMWGLAVKVFSNVLVILLNYVFSKLIIFKKKQ